MLRSRLRRLVPAPIRRADLALYAKVARTEIPVLGPALPKLSTAANHSRLWMVIAALLAALGGRSGRRAALRGMGALAATSALTNLPFKLITGRTRPDIRVVPEARLLPHIPTSTSFPSGHSASALAFATGVGLERPSLRGPLTALAGTVAFSRVYTGVHYPGDVLTGAAIGVVMGRASLKVWPLTSTERGEGHPASPPELPDGTGDGLVVVANVAAGSALAPDPVRRLREALPGARVIEVDPDEGLHATLERAAAEGVALGVAGGDGSASAAAAVAHGQGKPLAVIPSGTLNHLAGDLGVEEVEDTARAVREGRTIAMDVAEIDGRPFVNAASIGGYPHLVDEREELEATLGKWPAVLVALVRILRSHDPLEVEIDGRRRRIWMMFIGNCRYSADGVAPAHRTRLDDGILDVRIIHAEHPWGRVRVLLATLSGRIARCAVYERHKVPQLRVRSLQGPLRVACDGESFEAPEEVTVRKRAEPLAVFQPSA